MSNKGNLKVTENLVTKMFTAWMKRLNADMRIDVKVHVYKTVDQCPEIYRDAVAAIGCELGYFEADLIVNAWRVDSLAELDRTLAHEATHLVLWPLWLAARDGMSARQEKLITELLEQAVEQIAAGLTSQ